MIGKILEWCSQHITLFYWAGGISLLLVIITVIVVPLFLINVPSDFLINKKRKNRFEKIHFTVRILLVIIKNIIGFIIVAAGILMLILPGQGILTILIGLILVDFPGKQKLLYYILANPLVLNTINWIRQKYRKKKLKVFPIDSDNS